MTNDLSHRCYFWTFLLASNLPERNKEKPFMPQLSRFPVKKEESETICLANRGRQPAWGGGTPQPPPAGRSARPCAPLPESSRPDDRCSPRHPTGDIQCPPCHEILGWLQGHQN